MNTWLRSIAAVFVGVLAVFVLSMGTDQMLHQWGYIAAKFAPYKPVMHALALGGVGFVLALLGFFATRNLNLGPAWYPLALVVTAIPCAWLGGTIQRTMLHRH